MSTIQPDNISTGLFFTADIKASTRINLAIYHLAAAESFAAESDAIANRTKHLKWPDNDWQKSFQQASAAVMMATAALEANINEFYMDVADSTTSVSQLAPTHRTQLATDWASPKNIITKLQSGQQTNLSKILRKYNHALSVCGAQPFYDANSEAQRLIDLRNALMHFQPESDSNLVNHKALEVSLGALFAPCALTAQTDMVWFPFKGIGAGCAKWAIQTAKNLSVDFCGKLGIVQRL